MDALFEVSVIIIHLKFSMLPIGETGIDQIHQTHDTTQTLILVRTIANSVDHVHMMLQAEEETVEPIVFVKMSFKFANNKTQQTFNK